jgi:hypothetical protein
MDFTHWNPTFMTFLRDRGPKTKRIKIMFSIKNVG